MAHKILVSGERANFTVLEFDPQTRNVVPVKDHVAPFNASWIELSKTEGQVDQLFGLSEGEDAGVLYTFDIDHSQKTCKLTSERPTLGAPAHFVILKDETALALSTYMGGSVALYPLSRSGDGSIVLEQCAHAEVLPEFPYVVQGRGPDKLRQRQCHVHQILEDGQGLLYAPDLGSDRVWVFDRDGLRLDMRGWLQCPPGTGPRHAVLAKDQKLMYVLGELSHQVLCFELSHPFAGAIHPVKGFSPNVISPSIPLAHQSMMDAAEISLHPTIPNVLYVSNRWARHIAQRQPELRDVDRTLPSGDDIAIILLYSDGRAVESVSHVRTHLDVIRGLRLSDDGRYAVAVGQEGGGIEIYQIEGHRGDVWSLVASLSEGIESGLKHALWLQRSRSLA